MKYTSENISLDSWLYLIKIGNAAKNSNIVFGVYKYIMISVLNQKAVQPPVGPVLNPAAQMVNYIKNKCNLPQDQIERKLLNGQAFETMKGEGSDIDTKLMQQILNDNDFY